MSRDSRFPAHRLMGRVNPRTQTPIPATVLIFVLGVVLMVALPGEALLQLITAGSILPAVIYGSTIILYLAVRRRLDRRKGAFELGRFELPVAIGALVWSLLALFVLVTPDGALVPVLIVVGLLVAGGLFFGWMLIFRREVLETEPGETSRRGRPAAPGSTELNSARKAFGAVAVAMIISATGCGSGRHDSQSGSPTSLQRALQPTGRQWRVRTGDGGPDRHLAHLVPDRPHDVRGTRHRAGHIARWRAR